LVDYLQLTLDIGVSIDPNTVWRKIMEVMNMKVTIREDTWPYINQFFQKVPEAFQKVPALQEAFAEHAKQATLQSQQQTLLLILGHRFGQIPSQVTQRIERANELQLLKQWIEQALDAEAINQINFTGVPQT
jgi:midasin (ATPase involved in ribosome maturation)